MMRAVVELARAHDAAVPRQRRGRDGLRHRRLSRLRAARASTDGTRPFAYACVDGPVFDAARVVIP